MTSWLRLRDWPIRRKMLAFLLAASIVTSIILSAVASVIWGLVFLMPFVHLIFVGIWIFLMLKTYSGERIVLPVIGPMPRHPFSASIAASTSGWP